MRTLAIFARWPQVGRVKTRLAAALTPALAHALHVAMLRDALEAASNSVAERCTLWWADAPEDRSEFEAPRGFEAFDQPAGDLGFRLGSAFERLGRDVRERVVVTGSDCPSMTSRRIDEAFGALTRTDSVLGPATDGGFYLIGLARPAERLFEAVPWSTESTFRTTCQRIEQAGMSLTVLAPEADVDVPSDVIEFVRRAIAGGPVARHTLEELVRMGLLPSDGH